jgi:RHS repeat-associated protein
VDTSSGIYVLHITDIEIKNSLGRIGLDRVYRTLSGNPGPFGVGTSHNYGYQLNTFNFIQGQGSITLILPTGLPIPFNQQADGTLANFTVPGMRGAVMTNPSPGVYVLRLKNNTTFQFQSPATGARIAYLNSITDRNGNAVTLVRSNPASPIQITQVVHPSGQRLALAYDNFDRITSIADPIGRRVTYAYNSQGTLATLTNAAGGVTQFAYDSQGRLTTITDPRGVATVQNSFDQNGRVIQQVLGDGGVYKFAYTLLNPSVPTSPVLLTVVTDPLGNQFTYHFNTQGSMLDATDGLGRKLVYDLEPGSNMVLSTMDALSRETDFKRDASGNVTALTSLAGTPDAVQAFYTYDPVFNQVTSIKDALGNTTTFTYDASGNLTRVNGPLGHTLTNTYNSAGQLTKSTDSLGNTTQFAYSGGDLVQVTDPLGRTTSRVVDGDGRPVSLTNALGQTVTLQYNAYGQPTQIADSQGRKTLFSYDINGNLTRFTDGLGNSRSIAYDSLNRPISRTDSLGATENLQYDLAGQLVQFTDRRGATTIHKYDAAYRRIFSGFGLHSDGTFESTVDYAYDARDRVVQVNDSSFGALSRSYDNLNRLTGEITPQGSITYAYDSVGRRTAMTASGQQPVSYLYDNADRLIQINQGSSGVEFSYDADNRRTSLTLPDGITVTYGYDSASQLTSLSYNLGGNVLGNMTYTYDAAGQITGSGGSFARTNVSTAVSGVSYNSNNELSQIGNSPLTYDANGNLLSDGSNAYSWDARNQLVSIDGIANASFQYDPFGRRRQKTVAGTTTGYLYDGQNIIQELDAGAPTATLLTGLAIDEIFARTDSSGTSSFLTGTLNSRLALADATGAITANYTYSPFGVTTSTTSSSNVFQFTGRENDGTGLYYYRARYYNPQIGRFISEDPVPFSTNGNLYRYVSNNPISNYDPTGQVAVSSSGVGSFVGSGLSGTSRAMEIPVPAPPLSPLQQPHGQPSRPAVRRVDVTVSFPDDPDFSFPDFDFPDFDFPDFNFPDFDFPGFDCSGPFPIFVGRFTSTIQRVLVDPRVRRGGPPGVPAAPGIGVLRQFRSQCCLK